ncbi:MAG: hypothetical protein FD163_1623 [Hyphomonadaceae bacterium]|nr:MAG: hypothetical protein FD163_1623 [Hyphomonadaceae bacterium]
MKKIICLLLGLAGFAATLPAHAQSSTPQAVATTSGAVLQTNRRSTRRLGPLSYEDIIANLRGPISSMPSVRGIILDNENPAKFRIIASRSIEIDLTNLRERLNRPNANRSEELDKYIRVISLTVREYDPFKREALRVVIRTSAALNEFEQETAFGSDANILVRRPFIAGLEEVVVADSPTSIAFMPQSRLADLNLSADEAFVIGEANTAELARSARWFEENGLLVAELDGAYASSLLKVDGIWAGVSARLEAPVAIIIPNRERLVIGRANNADDIRKLGELATTETTGPHALTNKILVQNQGQWVEIP